MPYLCQMAFGNNFQRSTPVVLNLLIINGLVFMAQMISGGTDQLNSFTDYFALHYHKAEVFKPHQLVTHMFMHGGLFHLLFNMLGLWMFGTMMERVWGSKRFLIFYLLCGIGAGIMQLFSYAYNFAGINLASLPPEDYQLYQEAFRTNATVGASGAIMGVLVAFGYLFPNTPLFIMPIPFPIKAKWAIIGVIVIDIIGGLSNNPSDNIAHFAHLGGALIGFIMVWYWNKNNRSRFY